MKKKKRTGLRELLYYANPKHLSQEVAGLGYTLSIKKTLTAYAVYVIASILVAWLFELHFIPMVILVAFGVLFIPTVLKNGYKNLYEQQRFSEVTEYMEHMLYSFRVNHKILQSLNEVELSFQKGPMYDAIQAAKDEIRTGSGKGGGVERNGLKIIENKYPCERLRAIHKFMVEVEYLGGDFDESIDLLLEDRMTWVDRTTLFQKDKKRQSMNIVFSIIVTALICLIIQRSLPDTVSIIENAFVQLITLVLLVGDLIIYVISDSRMAMDWLETKNTLTNEQITSYYNRVVNYDEAKSKTKSVIASSIMIVFCGLLALIIKKPMMIGIGVVFALVSYFLPGIKYKSAKKALETEVTIKFPQWLMEVSLQLQSENVQVAVFNSIPTAPMVLRPELKKLRDELAKDPESVMPYLNFMKDFNIPEIQSSMKMLYSISAGTGGDSNKQIAEIIRRNNMMLDKSEKAAFENILASLYALFMAPQLFGAVKLLTDMIMFFVLFMGQMKI